MSDKPIVFYHNADLDGKCSAALVLYHEARQPTKAGEGYAGCELYGINYGDPFPWDKITPERKVYMVDFSLQPFSDMVKLAGMCRLTWIDHHKTALDEHKAHGQPLAGANLTALGKAGCELTWEFFRSAEPMPHAVMLLGRYDVWDEKCTIVPWSHILAFQYGMRLQDTEPESLLWLTLLGDQGSDAEVDRLKAIVAGGSAVLAYEAKQAEIAMSALSFETAFEGLRALAANRGPGNSKLFETKWDPEQHDVMISYYWSGKRAEWKVSVYTTKNDIDCGALCKKHGGGGHPKAAGFQCKELPFDTGSLPPTIERIFEYLDVMLEECKESAALTAEFGDSSGNSHNRIWHRGAQQVAERVYDMLNGSPFRRRTAPR